LKETLLGCLFLVSVAHAEVDLHETVSALTVKTVLVRTGIEMCGGSSSSAMNAGGQLARDYENALNALPRNSLDVQAWKNLTKKNCLLDCECFALSEVYKVFPKDVQKKISAAAINKRLAQMNDRDYKKCQQRIPKFCENKDVIEFVRRLNDGD
jgi:hypothetical protein